MTRAAEERRARGVVKKRRAQMYMAQLRWLEGFAVDGHWYVVGDGPAQVALDGLALARARRTVNQLRRNHRAALAAMVGDVSAWFATVDGVLRHLGDHVHGGAAAPFDGQVPRRVRHAALAVEAGHPGLRALIGAAKSAWVLQPDLLAASMAWMKARGRELARLIGSSRPDDLRRVLRLARLAQENEAGVDALVALLLADVPHPEQTAIRLDRLVHRLNGGHDPLASAPERSTPTVVAWVDRLLDRTAPEQSRALALIVASDLAGAIAPWHAWEAKHGVRIERAEMIAAQPPDRRANVDDLIRVVEGIDRARQAMPPAIALRTLLADVAALAEPPRGVFHRATLRLLKVLATFDGPLARVRMISHAAEVAARAGGDSHAACLWDAVAVELEGRAPPRMLGLWSHVLGGKRLWWIEDDLLDGLRRPVEIRRVAAAMAGLARDLPVTGEHARRLAAALAGGLDVGQAVTLIRQLDPSDVNPSGSVVRAAIALAGRDAVALAATTRLLCRLCAEFRESDQEALAILCERSAATGHAWLVRGLLERDERQLMDVAELGRLVPRRDWPTLESIAPRPPWIAAYPSVLGDALARLASVDPDGQDTARRRLARDFPDRAALEREVATLRARGSLGQRESRRLHNLETRMAAPRMPSPARLVNIANRLDAAALAIGRVRFEAALTAAARTRVLAWLGLDSWPGWILDRRQWAILLALMGLDPVQRALARRLLRVRAGPPPWDLRDDPVNQRFLVRMRALGLDPSPWLDDNPRSVTAGDGRPVDLAICQDPLDVFAMGAHFGTCLSPNGGNFFSVVTNASDVNKRVLYARREGKVVGRCLLALTDGGRVLSFYPYAHDGRLGFENIARDFAVGLAARMRGQVGAVGRVALLLGRDWYDDGARDLVGRYQALASDDFAAAIAQVAASDLVALVETTFERPLDDVTLPLVLGLPALQRRPELIEPLAPHLLSLHTLPDHTLLAAGDMAARNGDLELADRLLAVPAERDGFEHTEWHWGKVMARMRPSFTLARLRQTRPRGVRSLDDEQGDRLAVAALALETLRRPRQAAALYRRTIADDPWLADDVRPLLAALEAANDG